MADNTVVPVTEEPTAPQPRPTNQSPADSLEDKPPSVEEQQEDDGAPKSFFDAANMRVATVQACGATINGYSIGFVGVYSTLYEMSMNCSSYDARKGCETLSNADCKWYSEFNGYCGWYDYSCRVLYPNGKKQFPGTIEGAKHGCLDDSRCKWNYKDDECQNKTGYSPSDNGIFAGSMIVGCLFGSFFAGPLVTAIGAKLSFLLVGIVGIVCSVMYHVSAAENEFWVLIVGRFVIGLFLGVIGVACPMYVDQNGHPKYKRMIGVLFQVFTTFGIFMAAAVGLAVGQSIYKGHETDHHVAARMQALCGFSTLFSIIMIGLGLYVSESRAKFTTNDDDDDADKHAVVLDPNEFSIMQMLPRLGMGAVMAGTLQLTGINAVMNYAPTIMKSLGLDPLVGNFVVMVWNFVTTFASLPLASMFTMRQLFLFGSAFTSAMCLLMCGIPVYPGVTANEDVKNGVAITGILLFILGFELFVGPCYYVLTQDLFPPSFRPKGASITQVMQFIFNVIINVFYPIATEKMSGGASGDQDKGQAIAFIFFGSVGIACFIIQIFFFRPYEGDDIKSDRATQPDQYKDQDAVDNKAE